MIKNFNIIDDEYNNNGKMLATINFNKYKLFEINEKLPPSA